MTTNVDPALNTALVLTKMPVPGPPGLTVPVAVIDPAKPAPPSVAPPFTVTLENMVKEPFTSNVPAEMVVIPIKVPLPDRVSVPVPSFTRFPRPLMTPLKVVELLSPFVKSVFGGGRG